MELYEIFNYSTYDIFEIFEMLSYQRFLIPADKVSLRYLRYWAIWDVVNSSWQGLSGHEGEQDESVHHCIRGIRSRKNRVHQVHPEVSHRVLGISHQPARAKDPWMYVETTCSCVKHCLCPAKYLSYEFSKWNSKDMKVFVFFSFDLC